MQQTPSPRAQCPNCKRRPLAKGTLCLFCGAKLVLPDEPPPEAHALGLGLDPEQQPPVTLEVQWQADPQSPNTFEQLASTEEEVLTVLPADEEPLTVEWVEAPAQGPVLPKPGFWGAVGWSLLVLLSPALFGCFLVVGLRIWLRVQGQPPTRGYFLVLALVISTSAMLAVVALNLRSQARRALALRGIGGLHFFLVLLLVAPAYALSVEIGNWVTTGLDAVFAPQGQGAWLPSGAYFRFIDQAFEEVAKLPWPLALFAGSLLPGVGEEVFCRGFLGRGLVARYGAGWGVFLTSLLFALMHVDPVQIAYTLVLGVVLHVVYLTTRSLLGPMVLHVVNNALAVSIAKLEMDATLAITGPSGKVVVPPLLVAAALAAVATLCWLLYRTRVRWVLSGGIGWSPGYVTAEMPPSEPAVPRCGALYPGPALLAAGACLAFGILFNQAATGWLAQSAVMVHVRRGEAHTEKGEYDQAVAACTEAIRLDPRLAAAYVVRGDAHRMKGAYPEALADLDTALQLEPANAPALANRGETYRVMGEHDRALADCNRALQLDRRLAWAYSIRGAVHKDRRGYAQAVNDWTEALRLDPDHAWTNTNLAWLLATCPDDRYRQGQRAVTIARRACTLTEWRDVDALEALAAGHAECHDFREAIRWQEKAVGLATDQQKEFSSALLNTYRAGQPHREGS